MSLAPLEIPMTDLHSAEKHSFVDLTKEGKFVVGERPVTHACGAG